MAPCQSLFYPGNLSFRPSYSLQCKSAEISFSDVINDDHNIRLLTLSTVNLSNMEGQRKGFLSSIGAAMMNLGFGENRPKYTTKMPLVSSRTVHCGSYMPSNSSFVCRHSHRNQTKSTFFAKLSFHANCGSYEPPVMANEKRIELQCSPLKFVTTESANLTSIMGSYSIKAGAITSVFRHNVVTSQPLNNGCGLPMCNSDFTPTTCDSIRSGIASTNMTKRSDVTLNSVEVCNKNTATLGFRHRSSMLCIIQDMCRFSIPQTDICMTSDQNHSNMYPANHFVVQDNQTRPSVLNCERKVPNKRKMKTNNDRTISRTSLCDVLQNRPGKGRKKSKPSSEKRRRKRARQCGLFLSSFKNETDQHHLHLDVVDSFSISADNCSHAASPQKSKLNKVLYRQPASNSTVNGRLKHCNKSVNRCVESNSISHVSELVKEFTFQVNITSDDDVDDVLDFSSAASQALDIEFMFPCLTLESLEPLNIHIDYAVSEINTSPQPSPTSGFINIKEVNARWNDLSTVEAFLPGENNCKKVRFNCDNLKTTYPMIVWDHAYRAARIGPWEQAARDRMRFQQRIADAETNISPILTQNHRSRICRGRLNCI